MPTADMGVIPGDSLGDRVRGLRLGRGLTQEELAGTRFSKEYLSQIERGVSKPTRETITWLANRLGADPAYLETGVGGELELVERAEELLERQDYAAVCEALMGADLPAALPPRGPLAESWARMYPGARARARGGRRRPDDAGARDLPGLAARGAQGRARERAPPRAAGTQDLRRAGRPPERRPAAEQRRRLRASARQLRARREVPAGV